MRRGERASGRRETNRLVGSTESVPGKLPERFWVLGEFFFGKDKLILILL
jgi:hypothetical protein